MLKPAKKTEADVKDLLEKVKEDFPPIPPGMGIGIVVFATDGEASVGWASNVGLKDLSAVLEKLLNKIKKSENDKD